MAGYEIQITGVNFDTLRAALTCLYFAPTTQKEFNEFSTFVVPMQHNIENPIEPGTQDTWIQYWIDEDERITHDFTTCNLNSTLKVAHCTVRFLGRRAEAWARAFHHLTQREDFTRIFISYCQARSLAYISPIMPTNVDYFGRGNTTKAFTIGFQLEYDEVLDFSDGASGADRLEYISLAAGSVDRVVEGPTAD